MNILIVHTKYTQYGGEDAVVDQEAKLLEDHHKVKTFFFENRNGWVGALQFLCSIWNIRSALSLKKQINQFKPDIIHIHNWHFASGPIIIRTAKKMGIPIVNTLHNYRLVCPSAILLNDNKLFLDSLHQNFPWTAISKKVYKNSKILTFWLAFVVWFHKKIGTWSMVDAYICLTPSAIQLFTSSWMGKLEDRFFSKPNFSSPTGVVNNTQVKRERHFLFIGRLSEEKGIRLLVEAFKRFPYQLKIAGNGPLKDYVLEQASEHNNISYLGVLNSEQVKSELKTTEALIFPSIWLETFGLVIIEAFSNSCAVISTDIGAPKSIVSNAHNGFCFTSNDMLSLRDTVKKWDNLSHSEKESIRSNALKTFIQDYSQEKQHSYFKAIYEKVL